MVDKRETDVKDYINLWTWQFIIWCPITVICSFFGFGLLIMILDSIFPLPPLFLLFSISVLSGIYIIFVIFRNQLGLKIFKESHLDLLYITKMVSYSFYICSIFSIIILYDMGELNILFSRDPNISFTFISIFMLIVPVYAMFYRMLTDSGKTIIVFEQIFLNLNDYSKRQKWMSYAFKELEKLLKEGYINVPHDRLIYHVNLRLMKSTNIEECLRNIKNWMLSKKRDDSIYGLLKEILPEEEIKPLEKMSIIRQLIRIHPIYDYIKLIIIVGTVLTIIIMRPEFIEKAIELLFK